jgi:aryl-alcohol dehydrogenase-like predicted oxidoreductase
LGIAVTGPSVSDLESARMAVETGYGVMQLPYNVENTRFDAVLDAAAGRGIRLVVNRPFAMGKILYDGDPEEAFGTMVEAFRFILARRFDGVILSGTRSAKHLEENWRAFGEARGDVQG